MSFFPVITVSLTNLGKRGIFLSGRYPNGQIATNRHLKDILLCKHKESFYGALAEEDVVNGAQGIILSPYLAFRFFTNENSMNRFYPTHLTDEMERYETFCRNADTYFTEGEFLPNFASWKAGTFDWNLPEEANTEDGLNTFFTHVVEDIVARNMAPDTEGWQRVSRLLDNKEGAQMLAMRSFSEDQWLGRLGWQGDALSFRLGLRLEEPSSDGEMWKLQLLYMQTGKENKPLLLTSFDSKKIKSDKEREAIRKIVTHWCEDVPYLVDDEKELRKEWTDVEAWRFLTSDSEKLLQYGVEIFLPSWWHDLKKNRVRMKASAKAPNVNSGLLSLDRVVDFDWSISINEKEFSKEEFQRLLDENRRFILVNGQWMKLDPSLIQQVRKFMDKADSQGISIQDVIQQHLSKTTDENNEVDEDEFLEYSQQDLKEMLEIEADDMLGEWLQRLMSLGHMDDVDVPLEINAELRPYQLHGFRWLVHMMKYGFGALLSDDMGLGKTLQSIAYIQYGKNEGYFQQPVLVIAPTSVLGNWQKELEAFAPELKIYTHYGSDRAREEVFTQDIQGHDVVLTTYPLSSLDSETIGSIMWGSIILDEAQNIKNYDTKQSRAIRSFKSQHRVALTGTPIENRLSELWSIFDFLNRGYFGGISNFQKRFVVPIEREGDEKIAVELQKLLSPFVLRRTKQDKDVGLNLPEKQEQKEYVPLSTEQASLYEGLVSETLQQLSQLTGIQRRGYILFMLNKLKQICNHPALYLKEERPENIISRSYKMEKLVDVVDEIALQNEQVIIFTQYIRMGEMINRVVQERLGESAVFLHGGVKREHREVMIDDFQSGKHRVFILSVKAGGTGLNLTAANHVIHYDRWWNPAVENQATDRAYRIGQTKFVHVHKLITKGTLEEKIDEMLMKKQALSNSIITSENWITELSNDEIRSLLLGGI